MAFAGSQHAARWRHFRTDQLKYLFTIRPYPAMTNSSASSKKPRILFLSQTLPYPPDGGVKIRTFHTLRILSQHFDVTALCFCRWKPGSAKRDESVEARIRNRVNALSEFGQIEAFPIPQEHARLRLLSDHLRSLLMRRVYTVFTYDSASFEKRLRELLNSQTFALIHADSLDLSRYFPLVGNLPLVCVHHDAQSQLLVRRSQHESSFLRRAYLRLQSQLMLKEESKWCSKVSLNVTVSDVDRGILEEHSSASSSFYVFPNGVDITTFKPSIDPVQKDSVAFVGGTTWFPNLDALQYYASDILPILRARRPQVRTAWIGRASAAEIRKWGSVPGLKLTGYVTDIQPYVRSAACYIVPLRVGGGTRLKILDAWAMGKAVVSTSIGCEGLDAIDDHNIIIRDEPKAFADAVHKVLSDDSLRSRLSVAGRRTVEEKYSWESIGGGLVARYRTLIND